MGADPGCCAVGHALDSSRDVGWWKDENGEMGEMGEMGGIGEIGETRQFITPSEGVWISELRGDAVEAEVKETPCSNSDRTFSLAIPYAADDNSG